LEQNGFFVGVLNSERQNLLHLAAIYRRREAFMAGINKKVNHEQADELGNTPLHYACRTAQIEFI
jgi:ankyrin repeat protein